MSQPEKDLFFCHQSRYGGLFHREKFREGNFFLRLPGLENIQGV